MVVVIINPIVLSSKIRIQIISTFKKNSEIQKKFVLSINIMLKMKKLIY